MTSWLVTRFHRWGSPSWFLRYTVFWPWVLGVVGMSALLGGAVWGLAFAPIDHLQGNSYRIIYIHVPAAFLAQSAYVGMGLASIVFFVWKIKLADQAAQAMAPIGAWITALTLATGAIWGKPTWGAYWIWDARITTMFILFLLYLGILLLRRAIANPRAAANAVAILTIIGLINIPLIKYSVDWWFTLHQPASLKLTEGPTMPASMWVPLVIMILAIYMVFAWMVLVRMRTLVMQTRQPPQPAHTQPAQIAVPTETYSET